MCTFCSDLKLTQTGSGAKKSIITMYLKPNDPNNENEKYRFRILNYRSPAKSDRNTSFITRYVHNHWGVSEQGGRIVDDFVVCPATPHVDSKNDPTLGFTDVYRELKLKEKKATMDNVCPVCRHAAEAWNIAKASGYKDKVAIQRINELRRQFQGVVPVYVINDPVNEKNNGRFKCIVFSNQDEYKQFLALINMEVAKIQAKFKASGEKYDWCNGTHAVDFYLRMDKVEEVSNPGTPKEKKFTKRKITKMGFGSKAYDLLDNNNRPIITQEAIDAFEFDEQYYTKNTYEELGSFYKKYYAIVSKNIPTEDEDVFGSEKEEPNMVPHCDKPVKIPTNPNNTGDGAVLASGVIDSFSDDEDFVFGKGSSDESTENTLLQSDEQNTDDLLSQLNFKD